MSPRPWKKVGKYPISIIASKELIAVIDESDENAAKDSKQNARAIAALPDVIGALKSFLHEYEATVTYAPPGINKAIRGMQAALKKAGVK